MAQPKAPKKPVKAAGKPAPKPKQRGSSSVGERRLHTPEAAGSTPAPATNMVATDKLARQQAALGKILLLKLAALRKLAKLLLGGRAGVGIDGNEHYVVLACAVLASDTTTVQKDAALLLLNTIDPTLRDRLPVELLGPALGRDDPIVRRWRSEVFSRDRHQCVRCSATEKLEAHHINRWVDAPALRAVLENGVTLCKPCHDHAHGKAH